MFRKLTDYGKTCPVVACYTQTGMSDGLVEQGLAGMPELPDLLDSPT